MPSRSRSVKHLPRPPRSRPAKPAGPKRLKLVFVARGKPAKAPKAVPPVLSPEWCYTYRHVGFLRETIIGRGGGVPALAAVPLLDATDRRCTAACEADDFKAVSTIDELNAALDEFYALDEAARRKLLGGWGMERWPAYHELLELEPPPEQPTLVINASGRQLNGAAHADQYIIRDDSTAPVHLHVRVGTRKHEVIHALWGLWHLVETQWPALTVADPQANGDVPLPTLIEALGMIDADAKAAATQKGGA